MTLKWRNTELGFLEAKVVGLRYLVLPGEPTIAMVHAKGSPAAQLLGNFASTSEAQEYCEGLLAAPELQWKSHGCSGYLPGFIAASGEYYFSVQCCRRYAGSSGADEWEMRVRYPDSKEYVSLGTRLTAVEAKLAVQQEFSRDVLEDIVEIYS